MNIIKRYLAYLIIVALLTFVGNAQAVIYSVITNTGTFTVSVTLDTTETNVPINHMILGSTQTNVVVGDDGTTLYIARFSAWTTNGVTNLPFSGRTLFDAQTNRVSSLTTNKSYWNESRDASMGDFNRWYPGNNPTNWLAAAVSAINGTTVLCWQNSMVRTGMCRIAKRDTGMYKAGETVDLMSQDNSALTVYTVITGKCHTVFSGASPAAITNLPVGFYFAENSDDRIQFIVLPANYLPAPWFMTEGPIAAGEVGTMVGIFTNMNPSILRIHYGHNWSTLQTNGVPAGEDPATWDWNYCVPGNCGPHMEDSINYLPNGITNAGSTREIILHAESAPVYYATNTWAEFARGWTNYVGALMTHFKTLADQGRVYLEILNEPWYETQLNSPNLKVRIPFDATGCPTMDWGDPDCGQAYTNWLNRICDLVETTMYVKAALNSNVKIYTPSTVSAYLDLFRMMGTRGLTNRMAGISFHDGDLDNAPVDFYYPWWEAYKSWAFTPYTTHVAYVQAISATMGTVPLFVDETEYSARSATLDTPYSKVPTHRYNGSGIDWHTGEQRLIKNALILLAYNMQMWNGNMNIIGWPNESPPYTDLEQSWNQFSGFEVGHGPKPQTGAIFMLATLTRGLKPLDFVITNRQVIVTFKAHNSVPGISIKRIFTWAAEGETQSVSLPSLKDIYGNKLSTSILTDTVGVYDITNLVGRSGIATYVIDPVISPLP